jgi:pimeloyl-ACP methyl ester carboxylesterase
MSLPAKPSIVFAHGLWADGSCFSKLIPTLQAEGYQVASSQHSLDTPEGDVATLLRTLGRVSSPAILVGHSYGGSVITAAGTDDRVAGLVYIAALAPDESETSQSQQEQFPVTEIFSHIEVADGRIWMLPSGTEHFAGDLPEQEQRLVWATHVAPAADLFSRNAPGTAWRSKPSWYIVANNDHTVQPDLERFAAKRMGAATYEVDSSHVPMLSHPSFVLDVIRTAANAVQGATAA